MDGFEGIGNTFVTLIWIELCRRREVGIKKCKLIII